MHACVYFSSSSSFSSSFLLFSRMMGNLHTQRTQTHALLYSMWNGRWLCVCNVHTFAKTLSTHTAHTQFVVWSHPCVARASESESESESDKVCGTHYIKNANVELLDEGPLPNENRSSSSNHQFLSAFSGNNVLMLCKITNTLYA